MGLSLENSLSFDIFLNTATLIAVLYCFWGDIKRIFVDLSSQGFSSRSKTLVYALILGTIPAGIIGLFYGNLLEETFRNSHTVAWALIAGGVLMFVADKVNRNVGMNHGGITAVKGFVVGVFQSLALIPGVSRSGATISGGFLSKLSREEAIRFSFLLYIPISLGALLKSIMDVSRAGETIAGGFMNLPAILAFLFALVSGVWAVKFMVRYLSHHSFTPFIIYRVLLAIIIFVFL